PYFTTYSSNDVEGNRLRLGMRTSNDFSTRWVIGGHVAYGFRDSEIKYGGFTEYYLSKKPRQSIGGEYKNDVNVSAQYKEEFGQDNIFSGFYRRRIPQKLIRIEEKKVFYNREWNFGYSNKLSFSNRIINPYFDFEYIRGGDTPNQDTVTILNTSEVLFNARFAYHEKFVSGEFSRISLGTKYPVIQLQYTKGLRDVLESQFDYHKIEVNISDNFSINPIGTFYFIIEGGKVIGTLPYLLLEVHPGNETYFYSKHAFNNMNLYEFISDTYAKIYVSHHFGGFLFNKIPGVRKLKLRSLVAGKAVIGNINPANLANNTTDINTFTIPYPIPYMEVGGGIENILKILRLDATWRLNYFTGPNVTPFSVRLSLQLEF
ncbi:MAG: hypothetical protein IH946_08340, partial [Bacteroidetes bacterium]|nr:hypothetical protein [Bacteroidota bacterium]